MQKFEEVAVDSAQYRVTPRSIILQGAFPLKFGCLTLRSIILLGAFTTNFNDWFRAVWYCVEFDSAQYDTAQSLTPRSTKMRGDSEKCEYLGKNETKFEAILIHWSVTHAGWFEWSKKLEFENLVSLSI